MTHAGGRAASAVRVARRRSRHLVQRRADLGRQAQPLGASTSRAAGPPCGHRRSGAVTPGASRTQASATSSGVASSPSAAVQTASTMPRLRSSRNRSTKRAKCGEAARESDGVPERYLPVSTPAPERRPRQHPEAERRRPPAAPRARCRAAAASTPSASTPAARGPATACCQVDGAAGLPAGVVGDADVPRAAGRDRVVEGGQRLLQLGVVAPGVHLPEVDVVGAEPRQRAVQGVEQRPPRGVDDALAGTPGDARLGGEHDLLAVDDRAQQPADHPLGLAVAVARSRVEQRAAGLDEGRELVGRPRARRCRAPQVIVPRPSRLTFSPDRPSLRCSMAREPTDVE